MPNPNDAYEAAVTALGQHFREQITSQAALANTTPETLLNAVMGELFGEERRADGRAREWRVRARLYDYENGLNDPVADSDPDLSPELPGATIIRGMPAIIPWLGELASTYHGVACPGLDRRTLRGKIGNLRTMMTNRGDGTGDFRADYQVVVGGRIRDMRARCDVCRADSVPDPISRMLPKLIRHN